MSATKQQQKKFKARSANERREDLDKEKTSERSRIFAFVSFFYENETTEGAIRRRYKKNINVAIC